MSRLFALGVICLLLVVCGCATVAPEGGDFRELVAAGDPLALRQQRSVRGLINQLQQQPMQYRDVAAEQLIQSTLGFLFDERYAGPLSGVPVAMSSATTDSGLEKSDTTANRFRVLIIRDSAENAHALPDGTLVLHLGLLAAVESIEQLAFVLAHEGEHVLANHAYNSALHQRNQRQRHWLAALVPGRRQAVSQEYRERLGLFSRQQERQADTAALKRLLQRDINAFEAVEFFNVLQRYPLRVTTAANARSHPGHHQRLVRLRTQIDHLTAAAAPGHGGGTDPVFASLRERWRTVRADLLQDSIEQKLGGADLAGALVQIGELESLQSTSATSECLRGRLYAGLVANPVQARQALQSQLQTAGQAQSHSHALDKTAGSHANDPVVPAAALPDGAAATDARSIDAVALFRRHGEVAFDNAERLVRTLSDQQCVSRGRLELRTGINTDVTGSWGDAHLPALQ